MTSLLRRLSISLDRNSLGGAQGPSASLASHPSFNDFSLHCNSDVHDDDRHTGPMTAAASVKQTVDVRASVEEPRPSRPSPFIVGSAPAGLAPINFPRTAALKIPRPSSSGATPFATAAGSPFSGSMPRSSLDTPRRSEDKPASPRSPTSPRRRAPVTPRSPKLDGMEYEILREFSRDFS